VVAVAVGAGVFAAAAAAAAVGIPAAVGAVVIGCAFLAAALWWAWTRRRWRPGVRKSLQGKRCRPGVREILHEIDCMEKGGGLG